MRKLNALFMVFILSLNFISSLDTYSIDAIEPAMGIHSNLMEIKSELMDKSSPKTIAQFSEQLLHMLRSLEEAQRQHEEVNKKMMAQCEEEARFRAKEIQDAQNSYNAAANSLSKCQASLHAAKENLPTLEKALADYKTELKRATDERNHQHQLYLQRRKDWQEAILFLGEFIQIVNQKLNKYPTSFADLSERLLRHTSKLGLVSQAVPILVALTAPEVPTTHNDYTYKAQGKTAGSLKTHLNDLKNRLIADSKANDEAEEKAQKLYEAYKAKLDGIIAGLEKDITKTKSQIAEMNNCVATENAVLTSASGKLNRNNNLKKAAGNTCSDFTTEFVKATKNRLTEIKTVNTIINICKKRFETLPKELIKYLEEVKDRFKKYVNSTEFKKYVNYEQKHIADNANGRKLSQTPRPVIKPHAQANKMKVVATAVKK